MDGDSESEIKKARDAIQTIETIQSMIDVSADRLEGLRTQCSTSAELTQQEIRTLEGKLVKHFSRQLVIKARFGDELPPALKDIPCLAQWLTVVGLSADAIQAVCSRVASLEALRERSEHDVRALLAAARDEEARRLCRAMQRLKAYTEVLSRGDSADIATSAEMPLYWDSWERARPRARHHDNHSLGHNRRHRPHVKNHTTPLPIRKEYLPAPDGSLTKSRSHESQLSVRPDASDLSDTSQWSASGAEASPPPSPRPAPRDLPPNNTPDHVVTNTKRGGWFGSRSQQPLRPAGTITAGGVSLGSSTTGTSTPGTSTLGTSTCSSTPGTLGSPRTLFGRCMAHDIAHRFTKTFNMIATCDYCEKQMLFGSGLKCKECKFKCHRECESKVPPSCGLPPEFVSAFKEKYHKDGGSSSGSGGFNSRSVLPSLSRWRREQHHAHQQAGRESSSTPSSCNSSAPPSPAQPAPLPQKHHFHFPEVKTPVSSPNHVSIQTPARVVENRDELTNSVKSEGSRGVSFSGSGSTDSRADSLDLGGKEQRWPRQNSLSMREWEIPYEELKLFEVIGMGRFGTVYRGSWHGAVAVKLLRVHALGDHCAPLDTFKHEVATFRKTRHENLVLFMGACMTPPRLAIVTSLCKGRTLYTHIHVRKDKFTPNKSVLVAQQISQGMGYLHARGILHKDLKTKNIFLENGKVVITDFGLFSVTKLCFGNNARGDSLGIPAGWLCYLAPELARALSPRASLHLPFSKATDVYAFGTVWYELLCGEFPFIGQPPEAIIWQVGKGVKQSLANIQASRDIKDILMFCWAYRPSDRPDFPHLLSTLQKLPRKRLARSPSHPIHLSRSADSVF